MAETKTVTPDNGWIKIVEGDESTLPPVNKEVIIYSEEGYQSVEKRFKGEGYIYSHQTDSGAATHWHPLLPPPTV